MNDAWYDKIDRYLNGEMSSDEKQQLESELAVNKELENAFNLYKTVETTIRIKQQYGAGANALKTTLQQAYASETYDAPAEPPVARVVSLKKKSTLRIAVSVAASVLIVVFGYYIFSNRTPDLRQLAGTYIDQSMSSISQSMGSGQDSLQQGITAYNQKDYQKALHFFNLVSASHPENRDAKQYAGYVYLITMEYDSALVRFDELIRMDGRFNNGMFLKAATLLRRDKKEDAEQARRLLRQVITEKRGGSAQAEKWLKTIDKE